MPNLIVISHRAHWPETIQDIPVITAREYFSSDVYNKGRYRIFNLCNSYKYQKNGYYVSLLAEARGHTVLPNVKTITDMQSSVLARITISEIEDIWQKLLGPLKSDTFTLSIYFGKNINQKYERLASALFNQFPAPLLRVEFLRENGNWFMKELGAIPLKDVPDDHFPYLLDFARAYFKKSYKLPEGKRSRYDLAVLVNPDEAEPPSNKKALEKFSKAADKLGIAVEMVTRQDYSMIPRYDALFIRETTAVNHHTYRFAKRAEMEGLVVIDDSVSIIRCTNKVYLAELLNKKKIPAPETRIISKDNLNDVAGQLKFPCILKQPDSSFSQGVSKAENREEFLEKAKNLLGKSDLILSQEFMPTEFDWRIGILDGEVIFACKYFMAGGHWQVMDWRKSGHTRYGKTEAVALQDVPPELLETALKAAELIGRGLYGVDLKWHRDKAYVIEINDNPNLDAGVEDEVEGNLVYQKVAEYFLKYLERGRT